MKKRHMCKRQTWLWVASLLLIGAIAPLTASYGAASMDRHLAPDEYRSQVVKVLRTTNKAQVNSYVPVVFTLRNANPFSVLRWMRRTVQVEEGLVFTFVSPEGNSGKVLLVVPKNQVQSLRELVETIDQPGLTTSDGTKRIYRQLKHRRADLSDGGFLSTAGSFLTGDGSTFIADPETNALFWSDAPSGSETLAAALDDWLDVPTAMVQLVVKIYEVDAVNDGTIGLDYIAWKNGPGANLFAVGAYSELGSISRAHNATITPLGTGALGLPRNSFSGSGWNYAYQYEVSSAFFDYLAIKGKARILNQMKLAALNTRTASLSAGDQVLYYSVASSDPSGVRNTGALYAANSGRVVVGTTDEVVVTQPESIEEAIVNFINNIGTITPNTQFGNLTFSANATTLEAVETGLQLDIRPLIGAPSEDGGAASITFDIDIDWSDFKGFDSNGFPQINARSLSSKVRLGVGDEIVIGGFNRETEVKSIRKIPILGSIPFIGSLFGGETTQNKKTELVVSIQPVDIMEYNVAKDYKIDDGDQLVIDQASGEAPLDEPATRWSFDMIGADLSYGVTN